MVFPLSGHNDAIVKRTEPQAHGPFCISRGRKPPECQTGLQFWGQRGKRRGKPDPLLLLLLLLPPPSGLLLPAPLGLLLRLLPLMPPRGPRTVGSLATKGVDYVLLP